MSAIALAQYPIQHDPTAVTIAQTAFSAMGGASAFAAYQDSQATGTLTLYPGTQVSHPVTLKSKGTYKTRVEEQITGGTGLRIVNQGIGVIQEPDGTVKNIALNNLVRARVEHIPFLSLLSEYQSASVALAYQGTAVVNGQVTNVISLSYVPYTNMAEGPFFATITQTLFYVDQTTGYVDKMQYETYEEGNQQQDHLTAEVYFTQYTTVDGITVPMHMTTYSAGTLETDLVISSISFNVGLDDSQFTLPQ